MARLVLYLVLALALAAGIAWLANNPGHVTIAWRDWQLETSLAVLVFMGIAVLAVAAGVMVLWAKARRDMPFLGANRELRRQQRGLADLERAAVILAKGDAKGAQLLISRADRVLSTKLLTSLFAAQASLSIGDLDAARAQFEALAEQAESEILGRRGLLNIALQTGRETEALTLAARVWALQPKSVWATRTHFELLIKAGDWAQAEVVLRHLIKLKGLKGAAGDKYLAVLHFAAARDNDLAGQSEAARKGLAKALKADPGLAPAAVLTARLESTAGQKSAASKTLKAAWARSPHPDLAAAFGGLDSKETPRERYRRFASLVDGSPEHPFSRLTLAEWALAVEHYEEVATLLKPLLRSPYASQALTMMAEVERGKGGPDAEERATTWLKRITGADEAPVWECLECAAQAKSWAARCGTCGAFASQRWCAPDETAPVESAPRTNGSKLTLLPEALQTSVDAPAVSEPDPDQD